MTPVALHESGHVCADWYLLGRVPDIVTIVATEAHLGAVIDRSPFRVDLDGWDATRPAFLGDPEVRRIAEARIVTLLAGRAAERLLAPTTGYVDDSPPRAAVDLSRSLARLSPRDLELLADAQARPPLTLADPDDDAERAVALSARLVGEEARLHVAWLTLVAHRFVERHREPITLLARELMARGVMTGAEALAVIRGTKEVVHVRTEA